MEFRETAQLMDLLSAAYPSHYGKLPEEKRAAALALWWEMLRDYPLDVIKLAAKALIGTHKFPPSVAEMIGEIRLIVQPPQLGEGEAWGLVQKAIANAAYHAREEFDRLPSAVRRAVGSPNVLRQWALVDIDGLETVVHSNFVKAFRARSSAQAEYDALPADVKAAMRKLGGGVFKQLEG